MGETRKLRGEGYIQIGDIRVPTSFNLSITKNDHGFEGRGSLTVSPEHLLEIHHLQTPIRLYFGNDKALNLDLGSGQGNVIEVVGVRQISD